MAEKKINIKLLRATMIDGETVPKGETVEVVEADATYLVACKKAEIPKKKKSKEKEGDDKKGKGDA